MEAHPNSLWFPPYLGWIIHLILQKILKIKKYIYIINNLTMNINNKIYNINASSKSKANWVDF